MVGSCRWHRPFSETVKLRVKLNGRIGGYVQQLLHTQHCSGSYSPWRGQSTLPYALCSLKSVSIYCMAAAQTSTQILQNHQEQNNVLLIHSLKN